MFEAAIGTLVLMAGFGLVGHLAALLLDATLVIDMGRSLGVDLASHIRPKLRR
jgi:hypothetical protein